MAVAIGLQPAPEGSHCVHWKEKLPGLPVQEAVEAVSRLPRCGLPAIPGAVVGVGMVEEEAIVAVAREVNELEPVLLVAVTTSLTVRPTSALASR